MNDNPRSMREMEAQLQRYPFDTIVEIHQQWQRRLEVAEAQGEAEAVRYLRQLLEQSQKVIDRYGL